MFPADRIELCRIWGDLTTATMFLVAADAGLRPQEVAALDWSDWYPDMGGFVVHQAADGRRGIKGLKTAGKGAERKPALVSKRTAGYLAEMAKPAGFVFPAADGGPYRVDGMGKRFLAGLEAAGVPREGRVLYCLRHTFNTAARSLLGDDATVRDMMGHRTRDMTANYDHPEDAEILARVQAQREKLEKRWKA
jgi:integrase